MGWFAKKRKKEDEERAVSLSKALVDQQLALAKSQAEMGGMVGAWIKELGEISVKRSAALLGSRGGKKSQAKQKAAREAASVASCALCKNPNTSYVTVEMIAAHRMHESRNGSTTDDMPGQERAE